MFELIGGVRREEWFEEVERYALAMRKERKKWFYRVVPKREVKDEVVVATVIRHHYATHKDLVGEWYDFFDKEELVLWRYGFEETQRERRQVAVRNPDGRWLAVSPFGPPHDPFGPEEFRFLIVREPPHMMLRVEVVRTRDNGIVLIREISQ